MKKLLLILICIVIFTSCDKEPTIIEPETTITDSVTVYSHISPVFSHDGGIYPTAITVSLELTDIVSGCDIKFTLNGNEPNAQSDSYSSPFELLTNIDSVVVRAACFDESGTIVGNIVTNTYIKANSDRFTTDIICITSDSKNLYGSKGIITNPTMSGKDWERPAHIEYFDTDSNTLIKTDAGLRIFGGSSRVLEQKSFRIIARKSDYFDADEIKYSGTGSFRYQLFASRTIDKFDKLVLRNGGNDSMQAVAADPLYMNLLRDSVSNIFVSHVSANVAYQDSKFVTVFLNGEYYGILDMKEYIDDEYIENLYGFDEEDIIIIKSELDTTRKCSTHSHGGECRFCNVWFYYDVDEDNADDVEELITICKTAIDADESNYDDVYRDITQNYMNIDNFIEYTAINLFVCNTDWPHNNIRIWRHYGKFNFAIRDMDFAFGRYECYVLPEIYTMADTDTFMRMLGNYIDGRYEYDISSGRYPDSLYLQGLLDFLLRNEDFRSQFYDYCVYLASDECIQILKNIINDQRASIESEIDYHIEKWSATINPGYDKANWNEQVNSMLDWADQRSQYFIEQLDNIMQYYT